MSKKSDLRSYQRSESVVFLKTKEAFGGLSNMAGGFPLRVNGIRILTSEALYQTCRFPHLPEVQRAILGEASPMTAKMKGKPYRGQSRPDWDRVRVKVMRWCLRVKLAQNWIRFSQLLLETGEEPIVEESRRDDFWGARPIGENKLVGMNVLGRLLMELREEVKASDWDAFQHVEPLAIPDFLLDGQPIEPVRVGAGKPDDTSLREYQKPAEVTEPVQPSFFDQRAIRDAPASYSEPRREDEVESNGLKSYVRMKGSGVAWLGEVPEHWEVLRLRNLADMRVSNVDKHTNEGEQPVRLCNYVDVYKNDYIRLSMNFMRATATKDEIARFRLVAGDVLITKDSEAWDDIGIPALVLESADDLVCGYHLALLRPIEGRIAGGYLFRALQSIGVQYQLHVEANGVTRYGLSHAAIKSLWLPIPPLPEQAAIVQFLDYLDRRIRRYIRAKQKLIKLLEEQKQAIIYRAVTRGLDPNVRLKPSGVEWLGDVPEHWVVVILGRGLTAIGQGWSPVAAEGEISPDQWAVLTLSSVRRGRFNPGAIKPVSESARIPAGIEVCDGDLLLTRSNTRELVGDACIVVGARPRTVLCDLIYRLTPDTRRFESSYLMHQLLSRVGRRQIEQDARGSSSTMPKISQRHIRSWRMLCPTLDEQRRISTYIVGESDRVNAAVDRAQREIELLREYRTRLVADVVTGKLDVREAVAELPNEAEPDDLALDDELPIDDDIAEADAGLEAEVAEA